MIMKDIIEFCDFKLRGFIHNPKIDEENPYEYAMYLLALKELDRNRYEEYSRILCNKLDFRSINLQNPDYTYRIGSLILLRICSTYSQSAENLLYEYRDEVIRFVERFRDIAGEDQVQRVVLALRIAYGNDDYVNRLVREIISKQFMGSKADRRDYVNRFNTALLTLYLMEKNDVRLANEVAFTICNPNAMNEPLEYYLCAIALKQLNVFWYEFWRKIKKVCKKVLSKVLSIALKYLIELLIRFMKI
ncbi:hypothetical protein VMUT_1020 [Vulcanisaeta moutnovskia 768-28]|uniref:Uncharacterized protein n=1 Tax=Vulcanisaeta moutnovskia (strain 768-28) TaxID=985053 RepID=F0QXR4_VULM7|nr:hypothetical protein [Vulcanisaeta moutnovskia]ADY01227.1 hypothetical protein VMUT_1020 [Vulcanisaeta moutnovskia 768-28]